MTQEEKARRYDEAIERAREFVSKDNVEVAEYIFPELAEYEDKRIREKLIDTFNFYDPAMNSPFLLGIHKKDILAWFEKQGEQKSAEWHKGDEQNLNACLGYIPDEYLRRWLMDVIHVKYDKPADKTKPKFHEGQWIVWQDKCYKVNYNGCGYELVDQNGLSTSLEYGTVDENAHIWDITKDAKDGDVLASKDKSNILIFRNLDTSTSFSSYYNTAGKGELGWSNECFIPATKEQRNQLEKAMVNAGYTFDFEKKELKKIEQKSTWSEDDEEKFRDVIRLIEQGAPVQSQRDHYTNWLKSLKERVQPQPKQEWSKEDWNYIADLISYFDGSSLQHDTSDVISWLKTLKERYTWKPSKEQLDALQYVYRNFNPPLSDELGWNSLKTLELMCHDLKKLREE